MNLLKLQKLLNKCLSLANDDLDDYDKRDIRIEIEKMLEQIEQQIDERCTIHLT